MKLNALAAMVAVSVTACADHSPPPRAASMTRGPVMLPSGPHKECTAETLANASLWAGTIVSRTQTTVPATTHRVVYDRIARCDGVEVEVCRSWAWKELRQVTVATRDPIERRVETGVEFRGTMWSLLVDGEREGHLLRTNRDFAQLVRRLAAAGHDVEVTDRQRVNEPRFGRVHMSVVAPVETPIPAERWTIEFETSEIAVVELGLALDDLETTGIALSERHQLDSRAWQITPIATSAYVMTPLRDHSAGREQAAIVVSCPSDSSGR